MLLPLSQNLIVITDESDIDATGVNIQGMNFMESAITISGSGSSIKVDDIAIENNDLSDVDSHIWTGILVDESSQATISNFTFCNNGLVENVVSSSSGSTVSVESAKVCETTGGDASVRVCGSVGERGFS